MFFAKANDKGSGENHHNANNKFNDILTELNKEKRLRYQFEFYENEDHGSIIIPAEYDALQFIFDGFELSVKQAMKQPDLLLNHYDNLSQKLGYKILPDEKLVDDLAKVCERQELFEQSKELLKMNVTFYPNSWHAQERFKNSFQH